MSDKFFEKKIKEEKAENKPLNDKATRKGTGIGTDVHSKEYRKDGASSSVPGINTPGIELPAYNPPVPNRAWTAMRKGGCEGSDCKSEKSEGQSVSGINRDGDIDM